MALAELLFGQPSRSALQREQSSAQVGSWSGNGQLLSVMSDCFCVCRRDIKLAQN